MADDMSPRERLLVLAESDTDGYCDAATGACGLPRAVAAPSTPDEPMNQVSGSEAQSASEPPNTPVPGQPDPVQPAE